MTAPSTPIVRSRSGSGRVRGLDGLRGIAVLLVVAAHTVERTLGGGVGVTMFFVLSGFLITSLLLQEKSVRGAIDLRAFYVRRALRLFPALAVVLALTPLLMLLVRDPRLAEYPGWLTVTGLYVMDFARAFGMPETPFGHTWSLAVEEQFYLIWPLALLFFIRKGRGDARSLANTVMVLFGVFLAWRILAAVVLDHSWVAYSLDTSAFALLLGCVLATRKAAGLRNPSGPLPFWIALGGLAGITLSVLVVDYEKVANFYVVPAAILSAIAVSSVESAPRILTARPLLWLGKLSYGLYLWHFVLLKLEFDGREPESLPVRAGLVLVSLLFAWGSWHLVEKQCLRFKHRFERAGALGGGDTATSMDRAERANLRARNADVG